MICKACSREIPEGSAVCPYCGSTVGAGGTGGFKKAGGFDEPASPSFAGPSAPEPAPYSAQTPLAPSSPVFPAGETVGYSAGGTAVPPPASGTDYCGNCGAAMKPGDTFCPVCGAQREPANGGFVFCGSCGAKIPAGAAKCPNCGAPAAHHGEEKGPKGPLTRKEQYIKFGLIGGAAVLVVVVLCFILFGGRSYKTVVDKALKATFEADGKMFCSLFPEKLVEEECDDQDMSRKEMEEELTDQFEEIDEYLEEYDDFRYTYEIVDEDDYDEDELEDLNDRLDDRCDLEVSAAKELKVKVKIYDGDDKVDSQTMYLLVVKDGRSWYLVDDL